ncbi:MAG: DUF4168 domain-containing protein [Scytonema sp. PMC 1069.18]|nr:DUF4168 domain-containing protein [Scytonema sp. PMC 1069.18]MEC4886325.1 DUF4168 domain-containing protein [Scytonema sp. PMC 1070.18]
MKKFDYRFFRLNLIRILSHSLFVGCLATASLLFSPFVVSSPVNAQPSQTVNSNELKSYARALLVMEPQRQEAFREIKKIIGDREVPKIVCNEPSSFSSLPSKAKDIAVNYCKRSQQIVEQNGLTIEQFNKLTVQVQSNEDLKRQVYNMLIRLQKNPEAGK